MVLQFNDTILVACNTENDCPIPELSKCHKMLKPALSGDIGFCVPSQCESDGNCLKIGNECGLGSLSGTCNSENTCDYEPVLLMASCGKKILRISSHNSHP